MSVVFSGTNQGFFTATGNAVFIPLTTGIDYMYVRNETVSYAPGAAPAAGAEFYWQLGDTAGQGTIYTKTTVTNALTVGQIAPGAGFYTQNTTISVPGVSQVINTISGATPPVVATPTTTGVVNGGIVRVYSTVGGLQFQGIDFTTGALIPGVSFTLAYAPTIVAAGGPGSYRVIPYSPYFYPSTRTITNISQAVNAIITLSVTHNYKVGMKVRIIIPTVTAVAFGMTQLNEQYVTIIAINQPDVNGFTNTITVNFNTTGFTAFAWPLTTDPAFTPPQVVPFGENTATALNLGVDILGDAVKNVGQVGMLLQAGPLSPAGVAGNYITWVAGKSFNV